MTVADFLEKHKLRAEDVDCEAVLRRFNSEMELGLEGKPSSLKMIPTYLNTDENIKSGESVIVLDAGGTNFRTSIVTFNEKKEPVISDFKKVRMPGIDRVVSKTEFYSILADNVERLIEKSDRIGFCFSYAAEITPDHDGIPLLFSKEIKADEVLGDKLGVNLLCELERRGHSVKNKKIAIVNDTVATLLAAKAYSNDSESSSYIGFILGTGTNTAYEEEDFEIKKLDLDDDKTQIVNVESGNFFIELGDLDEAFINSTENSKIYHFEKKISGAYLGPFCALVIKEAIKEGLFSATFSSRFSEIPPLDTTRMSNYLEMPDNIEYDLVRCVMGNSQDAVALYEIIKSIIERAGKLTAINLSAACLKSKKGKVPQHPIVINADGTTFYKTEFLEFYTRVYLDEILGKKYKLYYRIIEVKDSPTVGAAIAALMI